MSLYSSLFCFYFLCILTVYSRASPFFVIILLNLSNIYIYIYIYIYIVLTCKKDYKEKKNFSTRFDIYLLLRFSLLIHSGFFSFFL